jgi:hypothetical protein
MTLFNIVVKESLRITFKSISICSSVIPLGMEPINKGKMGC